MTSPIFVKKKKNKVTLSHNLPAIRYTPPRILGDASFLGRAAVGRARRRREAGGEGGGFVGRSEFGRGDQQREGALRGNPGTLAEGVVQGLQGVCLCSRRFAVFSAESM